jgi:signal transduction histidine kinase
MVYTNDIPSPLPLQQLNSSDLPAWLWNVEDLTVIWANQAGLSFWDEPSIDQLREKRFDQAMPAIQELRKLKNKSIPIFGVDNEFLFWTGTGIKNLTCNCRIVKFEKGFEGLLIVAMPPRSLPKDDLATGTARIETDNSEGLGNPNSFSHGAQSNGQLPTTFNGSGGHVTESDGKFRGPSADDLTALEEIAQQIQAGNKVNLEDGDRALHSGRSIVTQQLQLDQEPPDNRSHADFRIDRTEPHTTLSGLDMSEVEFLAKVNHEVRTPLSSIIGFAEIMKDERFGPVGNEKYRGYLKNIYDSAHHALSLINDLLDITKINSGKADLEPSLIDLNEVLEQCVESLRPQAGQNRIFIRSTLAQWLPAVYADSRSVKQIILNILTNAIKFTEPNGQVFLSTRQTGSGDISMRIADTGVGMSEQDIKKAMQPFQQVETARNSQTGTGLGLPMTKALTEANGARFHLSSAPGKGTLVEIIFFRPGNPNQ